MTELCLSDASRDLRLHKLVFEEDGLPDGTELAYYIRGQVVKIKLQANFNLSVFI